MPDTITITGPEEFARAVDEIADAMYRAPDIAAEGIGKAIDQALFVLQGAAAVYPAPPPNSTYRRTGTLGRRWHSARRVIQEQGQPWRAYGVVGNNTYYGPAVQGTDTQAPVHRGRWLTIEQIALRKHAEVQRVLAKAGGDIAEDIMKEAVR